MPINLSSWEFASKGHAQEIGLTFSDNYSGLVHIYIYKKKTNSEITSIIDSDDAIKIVDHLRKQFGLE